jgi:alpha-amylase
MSDTNGVMMQSFHWYTPGCVDFWKNLAQRADELASAGITALWLPPAYKGLGGAADVGYGVYDMYDLGEFDQKGSVRTKYGTRPEYLDAIHRLQAAGVQVYPDAVLNHRIGGDETEMVKATPYPQNNRLAPKGELRDIRNYTRFTFPVRNGKYSSFEWNWTHFDAVDYDDITREGGTVYLFEGKRFDDDVALENGNFAYLMGCDLDFQTGRIAGVWYWIPPEIYSYRPGSFLNGWMLLRNMLAGISL